MKEVTSLELSYNEACTRDCSTLEKDLVLCEKAGFDYIEIRLDMLQQYLKNHTSAQLAQFFKSSHIKPHAINALYLYPELYSGADSNTMHEAFFAECLLAFETAREIGSHYVIVVPPLHRNPTDPPYSAPEHETHAHCVRILKKLAALARPYEVNLCFELVGFARSSVRSISAARKIVEAVNESNVGYVFDSYNIYLNNGCNSFKELLTVELHKIFAVHLMSGDDVPEEQRGQDKRCFCGKGVVNTQNFLSVLKEAGYNGMVSVETFRPEYWQKTPEWVIQTAYDTTKAELKQAVCL